MLNYNLSWLSASCPASCTPSPKPNRVFLVGENTSDMENLQKMSRVHMWKEFRSWGGKLLPFTLDPLQEMLLNISGMYCRCERGFTVSHWLWLLSLYELNLFIRLCQNSSFDQLLAQAAEVESLSSQVLQWKEVRSSLLSDSSAWWAPTPHLHHHPPPPHSVCCTRVSASVLPCLSSHPGCSWIRSLHTTQSPAADIWILEQ